MATKHPVYGKDDPERFIDGALNGHSTTRDRAGFQDTMTSGEMVSEKIDRKGQSILTAYALDNVGEVYDRYPTSMKDKGGFAGSTTNLKHSLSGCRAPSDGDVGAAGSVHHDIIEDH